MPNFGGSRLGFWYKNSIPTFDPNRRSAQKSNTTILIVGDVPENEYTFRPGTHPNEGEWNNGAYGYMNGTRVDARAEMLKLYGQFSKTANRLGYKTEYAPSYSDLINKFSNKITDYPMIIDMAWDSYLGPRNPVRADTIGPAVANLYERALQGGAGILLHGEVKTVDQRNQAICDFITLMGGANPPQTIASSIYNNPFGPEKNVEIGPEFLLVNTKATMDLAASARFITDRNNPPYGLGKGTRMLYYTMTQYTPRQYGVYGAMWKKNALKYPKAAIMAIFDITYVNDYGASLVSQQTQFMENMIVSLDTL